MRDRILEIVRFCIVGGLSFLLDTGLLFAFTEYFGVYYLYSAAAAFAIAVVVNYWLCVRFVFRSYKARSGKQMVFFVGSSVVGLVLNQVCMWLFVEVLSMYYLWAKVLATALVTVWNYVMKRKAVLM